MTDKKAPQNPDFPAALAALAQRHQLTEPQCAGLLGVPLFTFRKWKAGTRCPNSSALRLMDVLAILETFAPALHASMIPEPAVTAPRGRRKSPMKVLSETEK